MKAEWTNSDSLTTSQTTKAILVIDVPMLYDGRHLCNECPIWNDEHLRCQYDFNTEAKGCQLKPLPTKADADNVAFNGKSNAYRQGFISGYNCCIDEISGEW